MLKLIPMPKSVTCYDGECAGALCLGAVNGEIPSFIMQEALTLCDDDGAVPLQICCGDDDTAQEYTLTVTEADVTITASGYIGVFYGLQTLRQLLQNGDVLPCVAIADTPDYTYRGFYQDVSRGRIPTVDTVKRLVDRLSALKYNSLQLYVEHTHRFAEYVGINDDLGYYTDDEILEIDRYCREHCVELVPSLSSFGHLYYLLESSKYRHLCEMTDHVPTVHNWHDRLIHHTIDPSNEESFALITSLMEQYMPLFSSRYFNICCDETFDLCKGKNAGGDVGGTYAGFVTRLATFLQSRGKTVMMWGDIVMKHPQAVAQLPDGIVYLNWCYDMNAGGLCPETFAGLPQIVCPSVHSHKRFVEKIVYSVPNIRNVAKLGRQHGAYGFLNTNWGDYGHVCPDEAMVCGLAYGAAMAWNVDGTDDEEFERAMLTLVYRTSREDMFDILRTLGECDEIWFQPENYEMALWELTVQLFDRTNGIPETAARRLEVLRATDLDDKIATAEYCRGTLQKMLEQHDIDPDIGRALVLAAKGIAVTFAVLKAVAEGAPLPMVAVERWLSDYRTLWHEQNKTGEWQLIERFFVQDITASF